MSNENTKAAPPPDPHEAANAAALATLSNELAKRFPLLMVQRYVMPRKVRECREVFFRETIGRDEIRAGAMADATMTKEERSSQKLTNDAEKRESIRISIVAIGDRPSLDKPIVYRHVNTNEAVPFTEINDWTLKAWACLHTFFGSTNGIPFAELSEGIEGAQTVGALAPPPSENPTSGIPHSASTSP